MQTRLMGQYNTKWLISLVYVLKPLINAIRAIRIAAVGNQTKKKEINIIGPACDLLNNG